MNFLGATQGSGYPLQVLAPAAPGCGLSTTIPSAGMFALPCYFSTI